MDYFDQCCGWLAGTTTSVSRAPSPAPAGTRRAPSAPASPGPATPDTEPPPSDDPSGSSPDASRSGSASRATAAGGAEATSPGTGGTDFLYPQPCDHGLVGVAVQSCPLTGG